MKRPRGDRRSGRLFRKYVFALVGLVSLMLVASGFIEALFQYEDHRAISVAIEHDKAAGAAEKISGFVNGIRDRVAQSFPVGTAGTITLEERRAEYLRLLREVAAISTVTYIDGTGYERVRISRVEINSIGRGPNDAGEPMFVGARTAGTYYSPVTFRLSEPYLTIAVAETDTGTGVVAADVNLKLILEVIGSIKAGTSGYAYVVDAAGDLIAHPDISTVLRRPPVADLPQVAAARAEGPGTARDASSIGRDLDGHSVLTAHQRIPALGWTVFVDEPVEEAFAPVYTAIGRDLLLLAIGLALSLIASLVLAGAMVRPIRVLQEGAARLAGGRLDHRIEIRSHDELEALADEFNRMSAQLESSYTDLERKVDDRTADLGHALDALRVSENRLQTVMSNVPVALLAFDQQRTFRLVDGRGVSALGRSADDLVGRDVEELCGDDHALCGVVGRALQGEAGAATGDVAGHPFDLQGAPIRDPDGAVSGAIVVAVDVTERVRAEALVRQQSEVYEPLLKAQSDLGEVIIILEEDRVLYANEALAQMTGRTRAAFADLRSIQELVVPEDRPVLREALASRRSGTKVELGVGIDGAVRTLEVAVERYRSGERDRQVLVARDITERKDAERALVHQALHDRLTALPNRTLLQDRLEYAIAAARRERSAVSLLVMDLDHFKEVNDTFGHAAGDLLLREVGERLVGTVRESDTVARLGGDEFSVLLPDAPADAAAEIGRSLVTALERPFIVDGQPVGISGSVGVATYPRHGIDPTALLRNADIAMYVAKRSMSGVATYERSDDQKSAARLALTADLRRALGDEALQLHFQPLIELRADRVVSVEALARWQHPTRGPIDPTEFIPLAEQTGLIMPLTEWVIGEALRQRGRWRGQAPELGVSVNLSVRNLLDAKLPDLVSDLLAGSGDRPDALTLEITESVLMADPDRALRTLARLRELGVRLALDDYGTGYSSLAYLRRLPLDTIKIDRSFVIALAADTGSDTIVRSTIELGHNLGFRVVAEGVETRAAWDRLVELGCDEVQGYFVSKPLPAEQLVRWLDARAPEAAQLRRAVG